MTVVIVDARDSFVHILADYFRRLFLETIVVHPDHENVAESVRRNGARALVLGPGPGHPADSVHMQVLAEHLGQLPILGVCLGHQALGLALGGQVCRAPHPVHGKRSSVTHRGAAVLHGLPDQFYVTRYHSLVVENHGSSVTDGSGSLDILARSDPDRCVMAIEGRGMRAWGVQFHPESYGTDDGIRVIENFCRLAGYRIPDQRGKIQTSPLQSDDRGKR